MGTGIREGLATGDAGGNAGAGDTDIASTAVGVIGERYVGAAGIGIAAVSCARIGIIAVEFGATDALAVGAGIVSGAGAVVGAGDDIGRIDATDCRTTGVVGAEVIVVAIDNSGPDANSSDALVGGRTGVAIVAICCVVAGDATDHGVTGIVGADITIVAIEDLTGDACLVGASVTNGADGAV